MASTATNTQLTGSATKNPLMSPEFAKIMAGFGGSLAGGNPVMSPYLTAEERDAAIDFYNKNFGNVRGAWQSPSTGGGVTVKGGGTQTKAETKKIGNPQAYADYLVQTKGYTPEQAQEEVTKIRSDKNRKMGHDKEYKQWLKNNGAQYGLKVSKGKILGTKQQLEDSLTSQTDPLKDEATAFNQQVLASLQGLAPIVGQDIASGLEARGEIRDIFMDQAGDMDPEGLTQADRDDLAAMKAGYMQDIDDDFRNKAQSFTGNMVNRGFGSSNLFTRGLTNNVLDPVSRNMVRANAALASEEDRRKTSAAARRASRIGSLLTGVNALGSTNTSNLSGSLINPGSFGGFTDPQAAQFMYGMKQGTTGMEGGRVNSIANMMLMPTMPDEAGFDMGNFLGGGISGAAAGSAFGPAGTAIGAGLGMLGGSF